jgi:hypothetical protein
MLIWIVRLEDDDDTDHELYRRAARRHVMQFQQAIHFRLFLEPSPSPLAAEWAMHYLIYYMPWTSTMLFMHHVC